MKKLRLLQLRKVELKGEYKHLPKELIWLRWLRYPLKSIPDDFFNQDKLVVLEMRWSKLVQVWEGSKSLHNLKILDLTCSESLQKSPDFSQVPNLEELILEGCSSLTEIHPSIGHLKRLSLVNFTDCVELIYLPRDFYKLKSVETLLLNECSNFKYLHNDMGEMISLRTLEAEDTAITEVPRSIVGLKNLTHLSLDYNKFHSLPNLSGLSKLETLSLIKSIYLRRIPKLPTNLKVLHAWECPALETMPDFSKMSNMRVLEVSNSAKLNEVPGLDKLLNSMASIDMHGCPNLTVDFRKNILRDGLLVDSVALLSMALLAKISFDIPPTDDRNIEGLTLFCLFRVYGQLLSPTFDITVISNTKRTKLQGINFEGDLWQRQLSNNELNLQGGDKVDIIFEDDWDWRYLKIMRTGVNLVVDSDEEGPSHDDEGGPSHDLDEPRYVFDSHPAQFYDEGGPSHDASDKLVCAE